MPLAMWINLGATSATIDLGSPDIVPVATTIDDTLAVSLVAAAECPVFAERIIRGINTKAATPLWMAERLRRSGIRPLQPVVDVTNYVMLELGQPMHAYDLATLNGSLAARLATP